MVYVDDAVREHNRLLSRLRYRKNPQRRMDSHRKWFKKTKDDPERRAKNNAMARRSYMPRRERKDLERSGGRPRPVVCDICGGGGRINLDHCHKKIVFRGWLCSHCNLILGHAKDDPGLLRKLAEYLEVH